MRGKHGVLLRLVAAGDNLDRSAAVIAKFAEQFAHLRGVERIAGGVRNHRHAAAAVYPLYRVAEARPL